MEQLVFACVRKVIDEQFKDLCRKAELKQKFNNKIIPIQVLI